MRFGIDPNVKFEVRGEIERRRVYLRIYQDDSAEVVAYDDDECDWKAIDRGRWTGSRLRDFTLVPADWLACWASMARHDGARAHFAEVEDEGGVFDRIRPASKPAPR